MHVQFSRLALCIATSLCFQPVLADDGDGDPTPRLCDPTGAPEPIADGPGLPIQIDASDYCPPGEECYVGAYPDDEIHIDGGYCTVSFRRGGLKYVIFRAKDAPSSVLRCEVVSTCEIACASYPFGEGIRHDWAAISGEGGYPTVEADGNEALITMRGEKPVFIDVKVASPFDLTDASFAMENGNAACIVPPTVSNTNRKP